MNNAVNFIIELLNPGIKCLQWLLKCVCWFLCTLPVTTVIVALLSVIHGIGGDIEELRTTWGHNPGKFWTWLTHAFLHDGNWHLKENLFLFLPSSGLIELCIGRIKLVAIILFTAVAAAVMSGIAVPEYWDTKSNPVGLSAVAYATFALGIYIGAKIILIHITRFLTARQMLRRFQNWPWGTMATVTGMIALGIWLTPIIANERAEQDAAARVAHSFGMITGGGFALLMAITTAGRENHQFRTSTTVFAITVTIIAILSALFVLVNGI